MRFPDVDAMVRTFLKSHLGALPVHVSVPSPRPAEFIVARRNGGGASNRVLDSAAVTVDAWASTSVRAAELAENARNAFHNHYTDMPLVRGVEEVTGPYSIPDDESKSPRYRFTVRLAVRAARR